MQGGFHPTVSALFFERRRVAALVGAVLVVGSPVLWALEFGEVERTVEVALEPQIEDFAVEEEAPEEPEPEPAPPPPPDAKVERVDRPVPRPKIQTPTEAPTEAADESDEEKTYAVFDGPGGGGAGGRGASAKRGDPGPPKPPPPPKQDPPKPKARTNTPIDPTKPIDRPEKATAPKPVPTNAQPAYPPSLRDEGITGRVVVKLHVHRDGSVRGAKILSKSNNATGDEAQAQANKLFLAAVIKAVKTWKYEPATLEGKPISVWHTVTVPFNLTTG